VIDVARLPERPAAARRASGEGGFFAVADDVETDADADETAEAARTRLAVVRPPWATAGEEAAAVKARDIAIVAS